MSRRFVIPLRPKSKDRPRHGARGITYTPKETREYEKQVRYYYGRDCGEPASRKPVMVELLFNFEMPKSAKKAAQEKMLLGQCPYSARPDLDNIEKAIMDGLNGVAFEDDSQVVAKLSLKRYWHSNSIIVTITEMEEIDYEQGIFAGKRGG